MTQIIPAILETELAAIKTKVARVIGLCDIVQIDVMDGIFVPNRTYNTPSGIAELDIPVELHLMIDKPEFFVRQWALPNVQRIIVHYEALNNLQNMIQLIRDAGKQVGIALNPPTPGHVLADHITDIDCVLVMGVNPGFSGQDFQRDMLEKIKELKQLRADLFVAVDGGVNTRTAAALRDAGADALAANSALWGAADLSAALASLAGS